MFAAESSSAVSNVKATENSSPEQVTSISGNADTQLSTAKISLIEVCRTHYVCLLSYLICCSHNLDKALFLFFYRLK
jgi:hypothetical protein